MSQTTSTDVLNKLFQSIGLHSKATLYHNLTFEELFNHEMDPSLEGNERGILTHFGAVSVDTGRFTGRSPKDKYIVRESSSENNVWWGEEGSDNQAIPQETWDHLKQISFDQLNSAKRLYVVDGFCGANPDSRLSVRLVTEVAWQAHFFKNMFIQPSESELAVFKPDWTVINACKTTCKDYAKYGLRSEAYIAFHLRERMTVIGGTWYGGEMKKGIFSIMNYFLPIKGIGALHCSANMGNKGDTALFFGLSGTGKTTLSTDPKRLLIGDDEHGWDEEGIFNFEGGCYAKTINLSKEKEPDIYNAIKRNALLENVVIDKDGNVDFDSNKKTENTRVSYPITHIQNSVRPISKGGHPKTIIFLTCDAYGVLPPVAKLDSDQAMYQYLSGYTAKVAGTELGVTEPKATFSSCFGKPFLLVHPTRYAEILGKKMRQHGSLAYLINTGWSGGGYGVGQRISLKNTRAIVDAVLDGTIETRKFETMPLFNFKIPSSLPNVDPFILNPRNSWADKQAYDEAARNLAQKFVENFKKFATNKEGKRLEKVGPTL